MLVVVATAVVVVLVVASLPRWLPTAVIALRERIFASINGDEGIPVPGPLVDVSRFREVYAHPAANGRSRGAALSDLFWYWLAPGPHVHQEHLEPGPRYDEVARTTRQVLAVPKREAEDLARRCAARVLDELPTGRRVLVRLRDVMMPVWAEVYYELVFREPCPPRARDLIVANANDVVTALKCCGLRHMDRRARLTRYLVDRISAGEVPVRLPEWLSTEEKAYYLQGTFFNTAVVQMSEAMTHLLLAIAEHPEVQARLVEHPEDSAYLDHVLDEALRAYPLFGIAHRITSADIVVDEHTTVPSGSVLCFNYADYHNSGFPDPARFDPSRWEGLSAREATHIPFGVTQNRPCPAKGIAPLTMRAVTREVLRRFALASSVSHTRSVPNRGPCLLSVSYTHRDRWRSLVQLVLGSYMVWDARRQRLCQRYFETHRPFGPAPSGPADGCPVRH